MYCMYMGSIKKFFSTTTAHRTPKLVTLGVTASLLVAMINIDASASTSFVGRGPNTFSTAILMKLANQTGNREFSGVMRRHWPVKTSPSPTTTTPPSSGASHGGTPPATTTTTTTATTSTTGLPSATTTTGAPTTTTAPPATTTTTAPSAPVATGGPIIAGASRSECLEPNLTPGVYTLASLKATVSSFDQATHSNVTCLLAYLNGAPNWNNWQAAWITGPSGAEYTQWVAEAPQTRQMVLQVDLIPDSLENISNPLGWEQSCAAGDFNGYAKQLGVNLVAAGLQSSVIRLGPEMNGGWEHDSMGNTAQEQNLWATCFANEVTGLRQAVGEHFLIDWNPNACTQSVPYSNFYPGNAYVDILGLDFYDEGCDAPNTALSFTQLSNETFGLTSFETFAAAQNKPMSFPEWGLATGAGGDDPAYIAGIGAAVANNDFAFEAYFDAGTGLGKDLDATTPLSLAAFQKWFGTA
jgi:hypothetical protein